MKHSPERLSLAAIVFSRVESQKVVSNKISIKFGFYKGPNRHMVGKLFESFLRLNLTY